MVLLSVFAIVAFALGSAALFYLLAILAIAIGLYLAYAASAESGAKSKASQSAAGRNARR
ncbi:MAG: hypothetical protein QXT43_01325 [Candidatus Micrarchaeaceae archaeon]